MSIALINMMKTIVTLVAQLTVYQMAEAPPMQEEIDPLINRITELEETVRAQCEQIKALKEKVDTLSLPD